MCILVEEKIGQMKEIVAAITEEGISFGSILAARYREEDKRAVFPYLLTQNISRVKKKLQAMGFTLLEPHGLVSGSTAKARIGLSQAVPGSLDPGICYGVI